MPWFHPAKQSVNKQKHGKHVCRWIVSVMYQSLCGYLQESPGSPSWGGVSGFTSPLGGGSLGPGHSPCPPFLPLKTISCDTEVCILPPTCHVLSFICCFFILSMSFVGNSPSWCVWAFKKAQFKRDFFCEACFIPPKFRAASPVCIVHFQPLYASIIAFILLDYTCPSPPPRI